MFVIEFVVFIALFSV